MLIDFHGQVAAVTGGAGGIGYTCVKTLLESGARVAILDVNQAAVEWASLGVRVNCVAPGGVETPAMREMGFPPEVVDPIPMKKLNQPEDIANCVVFLASDKAATITGQTIVIDGGASVVGY